ncbi:Sodium/hydrogen exchanger [Rhizodiscina lignyota]|uniref:Sodium/hydrogen exchanger n=1 Tax=Rhizodiscina lignyota TaxID=1504668 RepID=A0A9P4IAK6_9PEZI|nr:Sodium/hydrogen exchanger [Rhizodiscina lignyota]
MTDTNRFLPYEEPDIIQILVLISFFLALSISEWAANKVFRAGLIGQMFVGIIYGRPLSNILHVEWQETFVALGYVGLIVIVFEGGLTARLDLLKQNLFLSLIVATTGSAMPIALSFLILYVSYGYGALEAFIVGAALSCTSLGTTLVVLKDAAGRVSMTQTKAGTVILSAAVIDDVAGLVMASVIQNLGALSGGANINLGWLIGRPIVASFAMSIVTPLLAKYLLTPAFRHFLEPRLFKLGRAFSLMFMACVLCAFLAISAYSGSSVLYGAFLAGMLLAYLPSPPANQVYLTATTGPCNDSEVSPFTKVFDQFLASVQQYVLQPLFFASIGFAVPFLDMWTGEAIWRGVAFAIVMMLAKLIVGLYIPLWTLSARYGIGSSRKSKQDLGPTPFLKRVISPTMLVGLAMVARGEIGLLIIQIGYNQTSYLSTEAFITAIWAIVLNTIVGPLAVGLLIQIDVRRILDSEWGAAPTVAAALNNPIARSVSPNMEKPGPALRKTVSLP